MVKQPLAITAGEPAGIGLDVILKSLEELHDCVVLTDQHALTERAALLNIPVNITDHSPTGSDQLYVQHIPTDTPVVCGQLDQANARHVLNCLTQALQGTLSGTYSAMVTAPLHKGIINDAGIAFTGHTEFFADKTQSDVVMLLVADKLRVALATTHLPLSEVANAISFDLLVNKITILAHDLKSKFAIQQPHIKVCGLNPHAGEQGHLGLEDSRIIEPAIQTLRQKGLHISGPYPADTVFTPHHLHDADAVFAMYHDQGLPVLKYAGFGNAVNTTLGLPCIRTSVDHGTAVDLAGTGNCDAGSFIAAIRLARQQIINVNAQK